MDNERKIIAAIDSATAAVNELASEVRESRLERMAHLVTKDDLKQAVATILAGFGGLVDPKKLTQLTGELKGHEEALKAAVAENQPAPPQPISG